MDQAAELALHICRFVQMPLDSPSWPRDWAFVPGGDRRDRAETIKLLAAAPKPVVVAPLVEPGMLAMWSIAELSGEARRRVEHEFANQAGWVARLVTELHLSESAAVVFETASDRFILTVAELRGCFRDVAVIAGWMLVRGSSKDAPTRLTIRKSNGVWSPGGPSAPAT